jgi:hypothetical protein
VEQRFSAALKAVFCCGFSRRATSGAEARHTAPAFVQA